MRARPIPLLLVLVLVWPWAVPAGACVADALRPGYRIPPAAEGRRLFYIQRSLNTNTVVYVARLREDGRLEPRRPVAAFWRVFERGGRRSALTWAEARLAYGVRAEPMGGGRFRLHLVSRPGRSAELYQDPGGGLHLEGTVAGRRAELICAFVQLEDDRAALPEVAYVDLYGRDLATGTLLHERIEE